jgi:hypothetical protein
VKPKDKELVKLSMDSAEFDRLMRGALEVKPPKAKKKQRARRVGGYKGKR